MSDQPATEETIVIPLSIPRQDLMDSTGSALDTSSTAALSIDTSFETHSLFSQKNMLRLAALTDSNRTLSLFTPSIRDAVFRAWAGPTEHAEAHGMSTPSSTPMLPSLSRMQSYAGAASTAYAFDETPTNSLPSRPTLSSFGSAATGLSLGANRHSKPHARRKRKNRVVNLRREKGNGDDAASVSDGSTMSGTISSAASESGERSGMNIDREGELVTPPSSPNSRIRLKSTQESTPTQQRPITPSKQRPVTPVAFYEHREVGNTMPADLSTSPKPPAREEPTIHPTEPLPQPLQNSSHYPREKPIPQPPLFSRRNCQSSTSPQPLLETATGGILEQAWMMKMAGEIARRAHEEKTTNGGFWDRSDRDHSPPPAYGT